MGFSISSRYKLQISKNKMANGQFRVYTKTTGYVNTKHVIRFSLMDAKTRGISYIYAPYSVVKHISKIH